jgi:hypothetical protein
MIRNIVIVLILIGCAIILYPALARLARSFWDWVFGKSRGEGGGSGNSPPPAG